ncbi:hypothetical protein [Ferrimicrobium sp.]|nr:hypothetical protein [Ferrimicrobium sp.]
MTRLYRFFGTELHHGSSLYELLVGLDATPIVAESTQQHAGPPVAD